MLPRIESDIFCSTRKRRSRRSGAKTTVLACIHGLAESASEAASAAKALGAEAESGASREGSKGAKASGKRRASASTALPTSGFVRRV